MGELTKRILDEFEEDIRSKELQDREDKLRGLPEKTESWTFEQYKFWFDTEFDKRITNESKNIFLNDSIQRAERGLKGAETTYSKTQSDRILHRINEGGKYLTYLREKLPVQTIKEETFEPLEFDNLSQKLLLLESLGVLKAISETTGEDISSRKMGRIISDLLGTKDLTRHLRYFNPYSKPTDKNNPRTEKNLSALLTNLSKLKLPHLENEVEKELSKLYSEKD